VLAVSSLGHGRYLSALKHSSGVIGNSSSGIIEAPSFNVPTINVGKRQLGRMSASSVFNCDPLVSSIVSAISSAISKSSKGGTYNPYGQGDASIKIVEMLKALKFQAVKKFHDIKGN
jgi:UDP-N-acetylglucosamine 2-epimerase